MSRPDLLGEIGCAVPRLANAALNFGPLRTLIEKTIGLSAKRSLPRYAKERFDRWFAKRPVAVTAVCDGRNNRSPAVVDRNTVILWDDTFIRYNEPHIGIAAVKVLEALGLHVSLVRGRKCCGRPAFSQGNLDLAAKFAHHNVSRLSTNGDPARTNSQLPIVFLEPSCYSMFAEDYRELKIPGAESVTQRSRGNS